MDGLRVVGLGGSLAQSSTSLAALQVALRGAEEAGAQVELFDVRTLELPMFQPGMPEIPPGAERFCEAVSEAHALIWSSPLYHGSISGSFKNAIDWLELLRNEDPPYLADKFVGLISTAGGMHGLQAINSMEFIVRSLRGWAVPLVIPIAQVWKKFDEQGRLLDPQIEKQLHGLGQEVVRTARLFHSDGLNELVDGYDGVRD